MPRSRARCAGAARWSGWTRRDWRLAPRPAPARRRTARCWRSSSRPPPRCRAGTCPRSPFPRRCRTPRRSCRTTSSGPSDVSCPTRKAWPLSCCSWGYRPLPAMPSCARASMIRAPAMATLGFERCASATTWSRAGSSKTCHHRSACTAVAGGVGAAVGIGISGSQCSSHGTAGRWKSGPTGVQPHARSAVSSAARRGAGPAVTGGSDIGQPVGCDSLSGRSWCTHPMKIW